MRIGELAESGGVTSKTVRYYESLGLLDEPVRTDSGYRDYDNASIDRLTFIRDAQATGLSLSEIASILELKNAGEQTCSHTVSLIDRHLDEVDQQIERLTETRKELKRLAARAQQLDPGGCTDPNRCQVITDAHP